MSIRVECSTCRSAFWVADESAGTRATCPRCKTPIDAPAAPLVLKPEEPETYALADEPSLVRGALPSRAAPQGTAPSAGAAIAAQPTRPTQTPAQVLAAFRGAIAPVRPTPLYRLWILIVAAVMVLLPLIYVGIVALACVGLVYHAIDNLAVFQDVRDGRAALLLYVGPLVLGTVLVAFMVKPLFARPRRKATARVLDPAREPLVFAFVDGVCAAVGSPSPRRIEVDCQVNASAHLEGGLLAPFGQDLVLTIGLPLVDGLSLRQFAGVLAHEFGHFSQRAGMRLFALIGSVNAWFARVVVGRDEWDETLRAWSRHGSGLQRLVVGLVRVAVWLTRRILWVLMMVGHAVSGFLSRQMEYDADRYQARMVGGEVFAATMKRIGALSLASQGAYRDLSESWKERWLPDNLPRLILAQVAQIPEAVWTGFRATTAHQRTGLFDTHPADKDRISRARAEAAEGIFQLDGPATDLFRDFDGVAKAATFAHYRAVLGRELTQDQLYPVGEAVRRSEDRFEAVRAVERFFLESSDLLLRPLALPPEAPWLPVDLEAARQALNQARESMAMAREDYRSGLQRSTGLADRAARLEAAIWLLKADFKIKAADFGLRSATLAAAEEAARRTAADLHRMEPALVRFESEAVCRLHTALALLQAEPVAARIPEAAAWREEVRVLYPLAVQFGSSFVPALIPLFRAQAAVVQAFQYWKGNEQNQRLHTAILRGARRVHDLLEELSGKLGTERYPFPHAREGLTLARFAVPLPEARAVGALLEAAEALIDQLMPLWGRVLGRLVLAAEEVEHALGLPPLVQPERRSPTPRD